MTDEEYFAQRITASNFEARGYMPYHKHGAGFYFGVKNGVKYTIDYDMETACLSLYKWLGTKNELLQRMLIFTPEEFDFFCNRSTRFQDYTSPHVPARPPQTN